MSCNVYVQFQMTSTNWVRLYTVIRRTRRKTRSSCWRSPIAVLKPWLSIGRQKKSASNNGSSPVLLKKKTKRILVKIRVSWVHLEEVAAIRKKMNCTRSLLNEKIRQIDYYFLYFVLFLRIFIWLFIIIFENLSILMRLCKMLVYICIFDYIHVQYYTYD